MPTNDDSAQEPKLPPKIQALLRERLRMAKSAAEAAPLIGRRERDGRLPLSCMQEWFWILIERAQHGTPSPTTDAAYLMPNAVRLEGPLNVGALAASFNEVIRRHEALRTFFLTAEGERVQVVAGQAEMQLPVEDLSGLPPSEREAAARGRIAEEVQRPFDLMRAPLIRALLLRLDAEEHVLVVTAHHLVYDGWSISVLSSEISALYKAFANDMPPPLARPPIQYADYTLWQREWLRTAAAKSQMDYWRRKLQGASLVLELPTDYPRPERQSFRGAKLSHTIPAPLTDAVKELSRRSQATLFMTLLAAFQTLLYWFSGEEDILVGTHISGRASSEVEGLIGNFLNNLVLRADLSGGPSFEALLAQVRETALEAFDNQNMPFVKLVQSLQPSPALNRSPLVQVFFVLQNLPPSALELHDMTATLMDTGGARGTRDMRLTVMEDGGGLVTSLQYDTALFEPSTIRLLLTTFERLLSEITARPDEPLPSLPLFAGGRPGGRSA
jgi:hypothetical protein